MGQLKQFSLFLGLLLMTCPGPPRDASGSHPEGERILTDFTTTSSDLGWYDGPFELHLASVRAYATDAPFDRKEVDLTYPHEMVR
jgi:hypothetical protein